MSGESAGREAASTFRERHGLGTEPIDDLVGLIERTCSVDVAVVEHGSEAHGMTMRHGETVLIGVARTPHVMRQRSTLAHELGHLAFDEIDLPLSADGWAERSPEEVRADSFARHVLAPLQGVRQVAGRRTVDLSVLSDVVQVFGVSPSIASIQLRTAGLITADTCRQWSTYSAPTLATRFGWSARYTALSKAADSIRPPQRLLARATRAYEEGVASAALIARLRGTRDVDQVRSELDAAGITRRPPTVSSVERPQTSAESIAEADLDDLLTEIDD